MIAVGVDTQLILEHIAQGEGNIVFCGICKAAVLLAAGKVGEQAHAGGVFAVGGDIVVAAVEIIELDALVT